MRQSLLLIAGTMLCVSMHAMAAPPPDGLYLGLGLGANFLGSEGEQTVQEPNPAARIGSGRTTFDTGARLSGTVGWGFGNGWRVELEGTVFGNGRKTAKSGPVSSSVALTQGSATGYDSSAGFFVNALYEFDVSSWQLPVDVNPYVGVGIGYLRQYGKNIPKLQPGTRFDRIIERRDALGAQGIVGLAFPIAAVPGLAATLEGRVTGRSGGDCEARLSGAGVPSARVKLRDAGAVTGSVELGLRYALYTPPAAPPASPTPAPVAAPAPAPTRTYLVFFDWDSAVLTDRARQILAEAARAMPRVGVTRIEVAGHADRTGTAAYNLALSRRRAEAAAGELVRDGVARDLIALEAFGDTKPLIATAPNVREPQNRRVEIVFR